MIEVEYDGMKKLSKEEALIKQVVETVLKEEGIQREVEVYVTLTNNESIHKTNLETRHIDRPTDVLSFPMFEREEIEELRRRLNEQ